MLYTFSIILAIPAFLVCGYIAAVSHFDVRRDGDNDAVSCLSLVFGLVSLVAGAWLLAGFVSHV